MLSLSHSIYWQGGGKWFNFWQGKGKYMHFQNLATTRFLSNFRWISKKKIHYVYFLNDKKAWKLCKS